MTEIVDDRQRLVAVRDAILAEHNAAMTELGRLQGDRADAVTVNWQGGKCNGLAHALQFAEHALASRPQEQPRKATAEFPHTGTIEKLLTRLDECPDNTVVNVMAGDLRALSVSPAAAENEIEELRLLLSGALGRLERYEAMDENDEHNLLTRIAKKLRAQGTKWLPAAPPSPAAQEQEKGEQT